jgi:hypothetical protein
LVSVTVPERVPVISWAGRLKAKASKQANTNKATRIRTKPPLRQVGHGRTDPLTTTIVLY